MAVDPVQQLLLGREYSDDEARTVVTGSIDAPDAAITGFGDSFARGASAGVEGLGADIEYFKGLLNTVTGDEEAAAENVRLAEQSQAAAAAATSGSQTFEEFLDEPSVYNFLSQVGKVSGQTSAFVASAIGGGGIGALVGRVAAKKASKKTAERVAKDAIERTAAGTASADEVLIAQAAYDSVRAAAATGTRRGAYAGAFGAEYVPASAGAVREDLESGGDLDADSAMRAFLIGAPVAAVGVGGEAAILKAFANVATKRSATDGSLFKTLATDIAKATGRTAAIEGVTETIQESIQVANRSSLDDTFTAQDGAMRVAEAAFGGFFSGGVLGGAGGTISTAVGNSSQILEKARSMLDMGQSQIADAEINREQFGDVMSGYTTPESQADINSQLSAMIDPTSEKKATWVAGDKAEFGAQDRTVTEVEVGGTKAYASFIPGRGTIISTSREVAEDVLTNGASDASLASALGYSATKDAANPGDTVVQVLDKDGGVVSEELTDSEGLTAAFSAGQALMPEGGSVRKTTVEKALEERRRRAEREQGPTVRAMDVEASDLGDTVVDTTLDQEVELEEQVIDTFTGKKDPNQVFDNTEAARAAFQEQFGEVDWSDPAYSRMTEAALLAAVREQEANPTADVQLKEFGDGFALTVTAGPALDSDTDVAFIAQAVRSARNVKEARDSNVTVVNPKGGRTKVSLARLASAGRDLAARRGATLTGNMRGATSTGLQELLADMQLEGYDVQIDGNSLFDLQGRVPAELDVTAARLDGRDIKLSELLYPERAPEARQGTTGGIDLEVERTNLIDRIANLQSRLEPVQARANDQNATPAARQSSRRTAANIRSEIADTQTRLSGVESQLSGEFEGGGLDTDPTSAREQELRSQREIVIDEDGVQRTVNSEIPLTRLNIEENPAPRTRGASRSRTSTFREATYPAGSIGALAQQVLNRAINVLRLGRPVSILGVRELSNMSETQIRDMFNDPRVADVVIEQLNVLRDDPTAKGRYLGFGNAHIIVVDNRTMSELETALTAAHELGHALLEEERSGTLLNPALRARMQRAFERARDAADAPAAYKDDLGFEEWYADQVAIWAQRNYLNQKRKARNFVEAHFNAIANKIINMFKAMSADMRRRFGKENYDSQFDSYMESVKNVSRRNREAAYRQSGAREATYEQKALVRALDEAVPNGLAATIRKMKAALAKKLRDPDTRDAFGLIGTADGVLRSISPKIANMFYTLSQGRDQKGNIGFLRSSTLAVNKWMNAAEKAIGTKWDTPQVQAAFLQAAGSTPTAELTGTARAIRDLLERIYDEYIEPAPGNDIPRRPNYFPVALDLSLIYSDPEAFIGLVIKHDPSAKEAEIREVVDSLVKQQQHILDNGDINVSGIDPAKRIEQARRLTASIPPEELAAFTLSPDQAFIRYIKDTVRRVEFNRATKDRNGNSLLNVELDALNERDRAKAEEIIKKYLGYTDKPLNPAFRDASSWLQFVQIVTLLPLATLSSFPELAGAVINAKEFGAVTTAFKEIVNTVRNRQEAMELARDIGVTSSTTMSNIFVTEADAEFLNPKMRDLTDTFFKGIGLDFFTRFTREFAANMGVSFLLTHANNLSKNPRSTRYLADLGLTAAEVKAWDSSGRDFNTDVGRKVEAALQQFVENSMLRPNSAERPSWASDPRFAIIWQLKGYFYSFGKVTLGGLKREMSQRTGESGGNAGAALAGIGALAALTAVAYLPLAMLGLELREYAKYALAAVLPGVEADDRFFRSDRMDWPAYLNDMFDRSGLFGPMALLTSASQQASWGQSAITSLLGPSAELVEDTFRDGFDVVPDRLIPLYSIVY